MLYIGENNNPEYWHSECTNSVIVVLRYDMYFFLLLLFQIDA